MTYTAPTRNETLDALYQLGCAIALPEGRTFAHTGRRILDWSSVEKPAFFQTELTETTSKPANTAGRLSLMAQWVIYHDYAKDPACIPTQINNDILDAIDKVLLPKPTDHGWKDGRLTLGGRVHRVSIEGDIVKIPGDLDNEGLLLVPLRLVVP